LENAISIIEDYIELVKARTISRAEKKGRLAELERILVKFQRAARDEIRRLEMFWLY